MENANKPLKTFQLEPTIYQKTEEQLRFENFHLQFCINPTHTMGHS